MTSFVKSLLYALAAAFILSGVAFAQAPQGASGTCKDGTYTTAPSKRGACSGHGGVKDWYADQKPASRAAPSPAPSTTAAPAPREQTGKARETAAPGGGRGQVWLNTASKVYHCQGDQWYGKTEKGSYMSEAAAKAEGARPARNKACKS